MAVNTSALNKKREGSGEINTSALGRVTEIRQTREEEIDYKRRFAIPSLQEVKSRGETISQREPSLFQKFKSKLPGFLKGPAEQIKEPLVGRGQKDIPFTGKISTGALGVFRPLGIGKTKYEKYFERYDKLVAEGVSKERADVISQTYVPKKRLAKRSGTAFELPFSDAEDRKAEREKLQMTDKEKKIIRGVAISEAADTILGLLDIPTFGFAGRLRLAKPAIEAIAKSKNADEIFGLLKQGTKDIPDKTLNNVAKNLVDIDKAPDVQRVFDDVAKKAKIKGEARTFPQDRVLNKSLTQDGTALVDETGQQVYPKPIKTNVNPVEKPTIKTSTRSPRTEQALESVQKQHGDTERIIESLKKRGVSQEDMGKIVLESGDRLVDTVKIKREKNGVLSSIITKQDIAKLEADFTGKNLDGVWIPDKTAVQKLKNIGKGVKGEALRLYELPQIFFERTGLRPFFYDPIREAEKNASKMKTAIWKKFSEAGLFKEGGWLTADRITLSKGEAEKVGEYFLNRQGKGGKVVFEDLSKKGQEFVRVFDEVIAESEPRFFKVAKLNGKTPQKVENYAPIMTSDDLKLATESGDLDFIFRKHPSFFSTKERAAKVPFEAYELDYRKVATRWIDQLANFNHLGEVGPQVKYLAQSEEFTKIVGENVAKTTNKWIQNMFNPQVLSSTEKGARFLRQKTSIASLGLNLASVVKQALTQVPLTILEKAPPKLYSKFAKDFGIKVSDLPSITERRGNVSIMDMTGKIDKLFVGPLAQFDKKNAQLSLNALLDKNYKKFLKTGKEVTPEIQARIVKDAQDTLDIWYGGMTKSQLPVAFRTELGKIINMFIYPLTSQLNGFIYSAAKAKGIKKAQKFAEVTTAALTIAYMEQVISNLDPKWSDTKEMSKDVLQSLAGNIPLLGQVVFAAKTDQDISVSPLVSTFWNAIEKTVKSFDDQASVEDVAFAWAEIFGLPKQFRRSVQGAEVISEEGLRDKNDKLLAPVKGTPEQVRAFIRGKYGTQATQDYLRNIGVATDKREWYVPEVEFLQNAGPNGTYGRKAELYKRFDRKTQKELYAELSEGQQKKLDKALTANRKGIKKIFGDEKEKDIDEIFRKRSLGEIFGE